MLIITELSNGYRFPVNLRANSYAKFCRPLNLDQLPVVNLPDMVWCEQNGNVVCPERGYKQSDDFESWFLG